MKRFLFLLAAFFLDVFFVSHFSLFNVRLSFFLYVFYFFCCRFALDELLIYSLMIGFVNDLLTFSFWGFHGLILSLLVLGVFAVKKLFLIKWNALVFFLPPFFLMSTVLQNVSFASFWITGNRQISFITVLQLAVNWAGCLLIYLILLNFLTKPFGFREKIEIQR